MARLVLASGSPRRRELIQLLGIEFDVVPSLLDERSADVPAVHPGAYVRALAMLKAEEVAERVREGLILGADTVVVLDGEIMGKPVGLADAARMLKALNGRTHTVYTGVALLHVRGGQVLSQSEAHVETDVHMKRFAPETLHAYLDTGEPMDKAGAYAIQGRGAVLIEGITGDFFNVVGLPVARLAEMLEQYGVRCL